MKKKIFKIIVFALFMLIPVNTKALGISASSTSITNGNTVKVTVNAKGLIGKFSVTSSNSGILSGGTSSEWFEDDYYTYTFNSKGIGSATITVKAIDASDSNGNSWSGSKSITIKVNKPREKSNNNNLKSLSVEGYTLSPEFSKDTLEYSVEVNDDKETVKINATKEDGYASVSGDGEIEVIEGLNEVSVTVTSETGVEKVYKLKIDVKDSNPIVKEIGGKKYNVVKRSKALVLPDGIDKEKFELKTVKIDEIDIPAYISEELNLTLIGLKDENNQIYLYKYENDKITDRYEILTTKGLTIELKEAKEIIEGYIKATLKVGEKEYTAYKYDSKDIDYYLVYGLNKETNEEGWYLYNTKENTMVLYPNQIIDDINSNCNSKIETYKLIIIGLSALTLILLLIVVILSFKKGNKKPKVKKEIEEIKEEDVVDNNLEDTKEIDTVEIIINKVEEEKKEIPEVKEISKKEKKKAKKKDENSEFLDTEDLKEILDDHELDEAIKKDRWSKNDLYEDEDMALDFLDEKKKKRR